MKLPREDCNHETQPSRDPERRTDEEQTVTWRNDAVPITDKQRTATQGPPWNGKQKLMVWGDGEKVGEYKLVLHDHNFTLNSDAAHLKPYCPEKKITNSNSRIMCATISNDRV